MSVQDREGFAEAVVEGNLESAEIWLKYQQKLARSNEAKGFKKELADFIDPLERVLFQALYKTEDWKGAKRVVESSLKASSKLGRKARLEDLSGKKYDEI